MNRISQCPVCDMTNKIEYLDDNNEFIVEDVECYCDPHAGASHEGFVIEAEDDDIPEWYNAGASHDGLTTEMLEQQLAELLAEQDKYNYFNK